MSDFPFLGSSSAGRSPSFDAGRAINLMAVPSESGASRGPLMLIGTPGLRRWVTLPSGRVRGCIRFNKDTSVWVAGGTVWLVGTDGYAVEAGTIPDSGSPVSMASNGLVIMAVNGPGGYIIDPTGRTTKAIDNENFVGADRVDFVDGYFVFNKRGTGQFQITGLYSTDIDGLDYATAEGGPDNIVSLIVDHREVWLFGENTTEVWINAGDPDFPFARVQGAFMEVGCAAAQSVAKLDNSIFWLATDDRGFGTVQRATGYQSQRVSTHAVEFAIAEYSRMGTIADAVAYTYAQEGQSFYVLSFPTADATWVFDASTNLWHERAYRYPSNGALGRHRGATQMNFGGLTIVGDWENGNLYSMELDTFTDNGALIPSIRVCPHIANDTKYVLFLALELTMQTGVGLSSGQGSNPQAMLSWSDDGGYSWSDERWAGIGKIGERESRVRWRRLGRSRDRLFMVTITDPVRRVITGASLDTVGCLV